MAEETKSEKPEPAKKAKAEPDLVELRHEATYDWTLSIEGEDYPVVGGVVKVPAHHVPHAKQAGFR